jgi:ABC-type phosphate/phosphonate transport system permease subunit
MSAQLELEHGRRLPRRRRRAAVAPRRGRAVAAVGLLAALVLAWWYTLAQALQPIPQPLAIAERIAAEVARYAGVGTPGPTPYGDAAAWWRMVQLARDTLVMSVLATGMAATGVLATVAFASRAFTVGELASGNRLLRRALFVASRGWHLLARAVPEFIWALLIVFVFRPGLLAGALALALHETGVLGRLASDVVDDVDRSPLRALRTAGASRLQTFAYGVLPQVLPQLVTFLLYRWEVVVRATVVVGFITGAGLGYQLHQDLVGRSWPGVGQVLLVYVLLVFLAEAVAGGLRRLAR